MPDRPFLNRDDVAAIGGVQPKTVSQHLYESRPEVSRVKGAPKVPGKFADDPFPAPNGYLGKAPWWDKSREPEIRAWFERHPRRAVGDGIGGRPRKSRSNE
jgi:hypothetical protein